MQKATFTLLKHLYSQYIQYTRHQFSTQCRKLPSLIPAANVLLPKLRPLSHSLDCIEISAN